MFSADGKAEIEILQLTDTHLFSDPQGVLLGCTTDSSLKRVIERVRTPGYAADLIIATGDLVHDESRDGYVRLREHLSTFGAPIYALPGNHDEPRMMAEVYHEGIMRFCDRINIGNWQIFFLNTFQTGEVGGAVDPSALAQLRCHLEADPECFALICMHHHPVPIGSAWLDSIGIADSNAFNEFVVSHPQIRVVIWGHIHQEWDETRGHARYLGTPSTCFQFAPGLERMALDHRMPGARRLTLSRNGTIRTQVLRTSVV